MLINKKKYNKKGKNPVSTESKSSLIYLFLEARVKALLSPQKAFVFNFTPHLRGGGGGGGLLERRA